MSNIESMDINGMVNRILAMDPAERELILDGLNPIEMLNNVSKRYQQLYDINNNIFQMVSKQV